MGMFNYTDSDGNFIIESGSDAIQVFKVAGNVVSISGSLIPGDPANTSSAELGSEAYPWKELYVESASINFIDTKEAIGSNARKVRFSREDVEKLKEGKSLNSDGIISASGDMHVEGAFKVRGRTRIEGETDITGLTRLRGTTHISGALSVKGNMDVQGAFSVDGNEISANELRSLAGLEASTTELNYTDGVTSAIQTQLDAKEATIGSSNRVDATEVGTGVITNTEFNTLNGIGSTVISTQLAAKLPLAGGTLTGVINEALIRCTDRDATPTVAGGNKFEVRYSRATSITMFDNPSAGQEITLIITDSAITFVHNTRNIFLAGARNVTLNSGDTITFISNGSIWYEKCRSDNS
jgi:hypothetical protein